jgi:hypothetical protein
MLCNGTFGFTLVENCGEGSLGRMRAECTRGSRKWSSIKIENDLIDFLVFTWH